MRRRNVVELVTASRDGVKPSAFIEVNAQGRLVYGVRATAGNLNRALHQARAAFDELRRYVRDCEEKDMVERLEKSVATVDRGTR